MGVLRVNVNGSWIDVGAFAVPTEIGSVIVERASFTPNWTGIVVGTGGVNTGRYTYIGGPNVGDGGALWLNAYAKFGTSGQTFPGGSVTFTLPTGFNAWPSDDVTGSQGEVVGGARITDADGLAYTGIVRYSSVSVMRVMALNVAATYAYEVNLGAGAPIATWAVNDSLAITLQCMAKKV